MLRLKLHLLTFLLKSSCTRCLRFCKTEAKLAISTRNAYHASKCRSVMRLVQQSCRCRVGSGHLLHRSIISQCDSHFFLKVIYVLVFERLYLVKIEEGDQRHIKIKNFKKTAASIQPQCRLEQGKQSKRELAGRSQTFHCFKNVPGWYVAPTSMAR